jgi:predicted PurR-regulated permease PerM
MLANSKNGGRLSGIAPVLLTIAIVILGLVYGRSFLVPIVIALLIATLIGAGSDRLQRLGVPGFAATFAAVLIVLVVIAAVFNVLAGQVDAVTLAWPRYVDRFNALTNSALSWLGPTISTKITDALSGLDLIRQVPGLVGSAGELLVNLGLVAIYVAFMLAERGRLAGKIENLFIKPGRSARMRRAASDISASIRRYIWIKTIMSLLTATVSYIVLKILRVDFAETWALLIFLLNYIPSIGSVLGVLFPALLALLQFDTIWQFFFIAIALAGAQLVIGNIIEPTFMGRTMNLSPFAVIASLAFWGMLWGIVGAFLSVPLTTALVIACSHVPSFRWIAVLLSADGRVVEERSALENGAEASEERA